MDLTSYYTGPNPWEGGLHQYGGLGEALLYNSSNSLEDDDLLSDTSDWSQESEVDNSYSDEEPSVRIQPWKPSIEVLDTDEGIDFDNLLKVS